jgi:hypothetical protein
MDLKSNKGLIGQKTVLSMMQIFWLSVLLLTGRPSTLNCRDTEESTSTGEYVGFKFSIKIL